MIVLFLRWFIFACSLTWVLVYFKAGTSIVKDAPRKTPDKSGRPVFVVAMLCIGFAGLIMFLSQPLICLGLFADFLWMNSVWITATGAVLTGMGIAFEFYVRYKYLRRFWSGGVEIREGHRIVSEGPYGVIRHPLYAGNLAIYPGAVLVFPAWWNVPACLLVIAGYFLLAAYEDGFLKTNLPGYGEYRKTVKYRLLPGIW